MRGYRKLLKYSHHIFILDCREVLVEIAHGIEVDRGNEADHLVTPSSDSGNTVGRCYGDSNNQIQRFLPSDRSEGSNHCRSWSNPVVRNDN